MLRAFPLHGLGLVFAALVVAQVGCEAHPAARREWRPEDHGQPREADPARTPAAQRAEDQAPEPGGVERAVAALWNVRCASCHGRDGKGLGPDRPPGVPLPDFTSSELQGARSDEQLAQAITKGRGAMPAFGNEVNAQGLGALVSHIRRMRPAGAQAPVP